MTAVEASTLPLPKHGLDVNMEDRKRPATHDPSDSTPPLKKQAMTVNGNGKPHPDADMPWKDDLERVQKDAILRQMQEYKREKATLESRLRDVTRSTTYHNDHLRIMDSWFKQLIDEVKVLLSVPDEETKETSAFPSALLFSDNKEFEEHLKARSDEIKTAIARLSSRSSKSSPEIASIQAQLTKKLAEEKVTLGELEKNISEKQQLEERLDAASLRYMVAEKKIDRAKSTTVAKLEKQYILGPIRPNGDSGVGRREEKAATNGAGDSSERFQELVDLSNRANAISEKRKEHVEQLEVHNSKLMSQATELNMKMTKLSDDDYAHTDLFKQLKSQHEEVIKRVNHLEAKNVQLREEAQKLQAERTTYRVDIEKEARATLDEREAQLSKAEQDLARIRNARDELLADQQIRKATMDQEKASIPKMKQFQEAKDSRIAALQSEIERLKLHTNSFQADTSDISTLPLEELQTKYKTLDKRYEMLNTELISMQTAYQKASKLAYQKINDASIQEERLERLSAEKAKADQKYFSAMKSKEARDSELRTLRLQNMKSSDIISQLKDADNTTRTLLSNVEKQLAETKDILDQLIVQNHVSQNQIGESTIIIQGLRSQVAELQKISVSKDSSLSSATSSCRKYETEIEGLKSTLAGTKKSLDSWKNKSLGNSSSEYEMLRSLAICTVCRRNFKNTAIKTCGHVFCKECVEERLTSRSRKCPNCNKSFGNNDYMHITL